MWLERDGGRETCPRHPSAHATLAKHAQSPPKRTNKWTYDSALVGVASCGRRVASCGCVGGCGLVRCASCGSRRVASCGSPMCASPLSHVRVSCLGIGLHWTKSFQCLTSRGESSRRRLPRVRPWQTQVRPWQTQAAATRNKPSEMIIKAIHL